MRDKKRHYQPTLRWNQLIQESNWSAPEVLSELNWQSFIEYCYPSLQIDRSVGVIWYRLDFDELFLIQD